MAFSFQVFLKGFPLFVVGGFFIIIIISQNK